MGFLGSSTGKSKGGSPAPPPDPRNTPENAQAYLQANPDVAQNSFFAANPWEHWTRHGQAEGRQWGPQSQALEFGFPDMGGMMEGMAASLAAQQAAFEEQRLAAEEEARRVAEENRRKQGIIDRDALYGRYTSAADTATQYIDTQIARERADARLLGVDYNITDELRQQRIQDYFSTIWSDTQQAQLESYFKEWGDPEGFTGWSLSRGNQAQGQQNEETAAAQAAAQAKPTMSTTGRTPSLIDDDEEEAVLA